MSSGRCAECGAMSSLWSPACAFCGAPASGLSMRTRSVADLAFSDPPTQRRKGVLGGIRKWLSRLFIRP